MTFSFFSPANKSSEPKSPVVKAAAPKPKPAPTGGGGGFNPDDILKARLGGARRTSNKAPVEPPPPPPPPPPSSEPDWAPQTYLEKGKAGVLSFILVCSTGVTSCMSVWQ